VSISAAEVQFKSDGKFIVLVKSKKLTKTDVLALIKEAQKKNLVVNLSGAMLHGMDLSGLNFARGNLSNADLSGAKLSKANFFNANLTNTNLMNADLTEADFSFANLLNSKRKDANMSNANLFKANL
jgi:uncharacterized protein YjbI with pentapeptide repeats